ncbi:Two-component system osmolarity sensor histidine kinase EnvZ [Burkholderia sp. 8Y]|uniref:ATP-binding protein n=1 Tax=Burkholderia sp. 8Y TaxID=2653133 RepID=UPI0012F356AD|nr:ATP-binding protein [Burkholderia sp. 8Y]VXC91097.1 Two-component system osmolarity sensor histidine kinase EnvZ [Burkholderia sp. 8Y]
MKNPLNSLFGRMAFLSVVVLVGMQFCWFWMMAGDRPRQHMQGFAQGLVLALHAANGDKVSGKELAPAMRVSSVSGELDPTHVRLHQPNEPPLRDLTSELSARLPPGTAMAFDDNRPPHLWVRFPGKPSWLVVPMDTPPPPRHIVETVSLLIAAILLSVLVAWQMQRPLSGLARTARAFGSGGRPPPEPKRGPQELRDLIGAFNDMMRRLNEADDNQAVMLAGLAHDLKAPLTRLKLRSSLLASEPERRELLRDIDSLSNVVQQFLEFAGQPVEESEPVGVDAFLREQFPASDALDEERLFALDLRAGPAFGLPAAMLDRVATNLVDNALEHGAPPIEISTALEGSHWVISVRDHGIGIPEGQLAAAMKPFVRLDPARGSQGHSGLGLAIVSRLTRELGGVCEIGNEPGGGFRVRVVFASSAGKGLL